MKPNCGPRPDARKRAAALAGTVILIAALNFVVIGSLASGGDDAAITAQRVDSVRALLAAESGIALVMGEVSAGREVPVGQRTLPSGQTITIEAEGTPPTLEVEITGRSGRAQRAIRIQIN